MSITDPAELYASLVDDEMPWQDSALCAEVGTDVFFPAKGESSEPAKRVCRCCAVTAECLEYALDLHIHHGIWGGMSERERRRLKREMRAA